MSHSFFEVKVPKARAVQVCSLAGYSNVREDIYVNDLGEVTWLKEGHPTLLAYYVHNQDKGSPAHKVVLPQNDGSVMKCRVSKLVAEAFLGPVPGGMIVGRKDGNGLNDCLDNLYYTNRSDYLKSRRAYKRLKQRVWRPKARRVAIEKNGKWQIFGSIKATATHISMENGFVGENTGNLRNIAEINTKRLLEKVSIPGVTGWRRLGGYKALFFDELDSGNQDFIKKRLKN